MRKIFAVILTLALVMSFASCGSQTEQGTAEGGKVLRVAMECAYAPYNWTQPTDANGAVPIAESSDYAYGYDVMIAKYLAEQLGWELEIYKIAWDALPMAVQSGTVDCVIAGQSITSERLETVDFTTPYYYASIYAVTTAGSAFADAKSLADLAGATATSQMGTVWYTECIPQIPNVNQLPAMEDTAGMFVALEAGTCDVLVCDEPAALGALAVYSDFVMLDLSAGDFVVSDEEINIGISLKKGNTELLDALNGALANLTKDDFTRMMDEAIQLSSQL